MSRRSMVNLGVLVGLVLALVIILWPSAPPPTTDAERTNAIADRLRCPYCNGESIADAPSAIARDLQDFIGEEVARGATDDEIIDFFVVTYGEQVLLDPPWGGWGVWLWLLPLLGLAGGGLAIGNRLRGRSTRPPSDRDAIAEQISAVQQDLDDLEIQVAAGEVTVDDAERLRVSYETEADLLERLEPGDAQPIGRQRMLVGGLVLVIGVAALTFGVIAVADDRGDNDLITGGIGGTSLDDVTNEEMELVIAENPEIVGMRLALAERYFEAGEFSDALRHYIEVMRQQDNAEAFANVGWMTFLSGDADTALSLVERALVVDPDHLQAYWFLANIRFYAFDDAGGAVPPLERLLAAEIPDDIREEAELLLEEAREAL